MVNMYSSSMMPIGMNNTQGTANVHQNFKSKYGVGYEDFNSRPYAQPYPSAIIPERQVSMDKNWFTRFIKKCFLV